MVVLASIIFRFKDLLSNPVCLFSDEVDAGYQAYVFNQCGNDYYGNKLPTHFQSFADQRTPFYLYSIAFTQKILGFSELSVRLPSAIYGFLVCGLFGVMIWKLFGKNLWLALVGFAAMSFNPWLFHYSRGAWEVTGMLMSIILAILGWIYYLERKRFWILVFSLVFYCFAFYFYATSKLFMVLLGIPILVIWFKDILKVRRKHVAGAILVLALVSLPMARDTINGKAGYRFSYINIFSDPTNGDSVDRARYEDGLSLWGSDAIGVSSNTESKFVHNKLTLLGSKFIRNYFSAFSTNYLFLNGDGHKRQGFGNKGNFFYPDLIFLVIGLSVALSKKDKWMKLMVWFLILAPVPYALTRDSISPQSTRLILMVIPLMFFVITGINRVFEKIKTKGSVVIGVFVVILTAIYGASFYDFYHYYNFHYPQVSAKEWHYGMKQAVISSLSRQDDYDKIYYSSVYEPFLPFFYYYSKYLPSSGSCAPAKDTIWDNNYFFEGMQAENKYYFGFVNWNKLLDTYSGNNLYVIPEMELVRVEEAANNKGLGVEPIEVIEKRFMIQEKIYLIEIK